MIILHAGFSNNKLLLWGEIPPDSNKNQKQKKDESLESLPYDAGFKVLAKTLKEIGHEQKIYKRDSSQAVLWLPSKGDIPIASSRMIDNPPTNRRKIEIAPWHVTVLTFDMELSIKRHTRFSPDE